MAFIMNASSVEQSVQVQGAWFTFKPKQIKLLDDNKAFFLVSNRSDLGFVSIPDSYEDAEWKASPEGKAAIADAEQNGVANRCRFLEYLKNNELISLRKDKEKSRDTSDPRLDMSPQMIKQLEELASYKTTAEKAKTDKIQKIADLEKILEG